MRNNSRNCDCNCNCKSTTRKSASRKATRRTYSSDDLRNIYAATDGTPSYKRDRKFYNTLAKKFGVTYKAIYNKVARLESRWVESDRY